jgi:hypothetical protein
MAVDFAAKRKEAEKAGLLSSGDYLKLKEGANRFRLLTECLPHKGEFQGKPNFKWICLVLDRADGKVKPFFMPHTIYKQIEALQVSEDYAFSDVPMPYDLTINADGAGTKEVKYTLMPARRETPLTEAELDLLASAKPVADVKKALDEKNKKGADEHGQRRGGDVQEHGGPGDLTDDDIPF